jgi:VRR-NUC domain-containing protein
MMRNFLTQKTTRSRKSVRLKSLIPSEEFEHISFINWLIKNGYDKFSHAANGGSRHILEAVKLKRMGVSKGFPDIFIPLPIHPYHGFFVEMKRISGSKITPEQLNWISYLKENGYFAEIALGCEAAIQLFLKYLNN